MRLFGKGPEMMPASRLLAIVFAAAAIGVSAAAAAGSGQVFRLHDEGYGPVRVGMTIAQAERALSAPLVPADDSSPADGCWHVKPARGHQGVQFMVQQGRISRASLWGDPSPIRTVRGVGIGDPEAKVRRLYGPHLRSEPHAYDGPSAHYLTYWTRNGSRGVRFETDDHGRVQTIHAGDRSIQLIEGCS